MKNHSTMLTKEGEDWLHTPAKKISMPAIVVDLVQAFSGSYGVTQTDATIAVLQAMSLMTGPSHLVEDPFGRTYPLSLQIVSKCPPGCPYGRFLATICRGVIDVFAVEFGRDALRVKASAKAVNGEETLKEDAAMRALREERQRSIFPFAEVLSPGLIHDLALECKEVAIASFSEGLALQSYLEEPAATRRGIRQFVNAGWSGMTVPGLAGHPVYPTVSLAWIGSPALTATAIEKGIVGELLGLLIYQPESGSGVDRVVEGCSPAKVIQVWQAYVGDFATTTRMPLALRQMAPQALPTLQFDDDGAMAIRRSAGLVNHAVPGSHAAAVLAQAPQQISKLAGLLSISNLKNETVVKGCYVTTATELFRHLAKATIETLAAPETEVDELEIGVEVLLGKLRAAGPLTVRGLSRKYDSQKKERIERFLSESMKRGLVEVSDGKYHVTGSLAGENSDNCQCVSASVADLPTNLVEFQEAL